MLTDPTSPGVRRPRERSEALLEPARRRRRPAHREVRRGAHGRGHGPLGDGRRDRRPADQLGCGRTYARTQVQV